jgi:D-glycero-beta-D-manno-heptose-7-phosphate kinase
LGLTETFTSFDSMNVLIIGDVMVDSYVWGKVNRISPEAPVPIVQVQRRENRLGGAANVALNVAALGATPIMCATIGSDEEAKVFYQLLREARLSHEGILRSEERVTTVKHRIMAGSQHLLRIDAEDDAPISGDDTATLAKRVLDLLPKSDVVIFEDYDKGVLTPALIGEVIHHAGRLGIPTVVDPKKRNFLAYAHCSLFKPNLKELREGLNLEVDGKSTASIRQAAGALRQQMPVERLMATLSELGVFITDFQHDFHLPAHRREIADVSGAGDTVISIAALCLAAGLPLRQVAGIANLGGGLVCESLGVVPIEKGRLLREALLHFS